MILGLFVQLLLFHSKNKICFFSRVEVENLLGQKDYKRTNRTEICFDKIELFLVSSFYFSSGDEG